MFHEKTIKENPLSSRQDMVDCLNTLLSALDEQFTENQSGILLGQTCAHYGPDIARMEGLSRVLWGIFPLLASGDKTPYSDKYLNAIRQGTNPEHPEFWGNAGPYDQRLVEMAVYGLGLALMKESLTEYFTPEELQNLYLWLNQITDAEMPDSNWNYFAIIVQLGFKQAGLPWDPEAIEKRFAKMEAYYLDNGWYSDGPGRPKDYYISMAFHYYGLIYATLMAEDDPQRAGVLRQRAIEFADSFIHMFAADGAAMPFGRSLIYRFAEAAFWSAVAFSGLDIFSHGNFLTQGDFPTQGEIKGIILRHLRWWFKHPILDRDGILTIGYTYPNLVMAEDYNSPGSPYWAFKLFLILALPESHPFWQSEEKSLPRLPNKRVIPQAAQILVRDSESEHVYMLTSGQLELNNYVNTEAKYTKFAYSSLFGFTVERGRFGLKHAACDSMLLLAEQDNYYRGRRECTDVLTTDEFIRSHWSPWHDVHIVTWLIPCGDWHIRVHHIDTARVLDAVEGGFAVKYIPATTVSAIKPGSSHVQAENGYCKIVNSDMGINRQADTLITPPNSSIMFAECAAIPILTTPIGIGEHWLCCAVSASGPDQRDITDPPEITLQDNILSLFHREQMKNITLSIDLLF